MTVDDKLQRAARDARAAVAGHRGDPIVAVRHRLVLMRFAAFGLGALVVLVGVGLVMLGRDGASGTQLVPPAQRVTTSTVAETTTSAAPETTAESTIATASAPLGDGLSDTSMIPSSWKDSSGEFLLAERGVAIVAHPMSDADGNDIAGEWVFQAWERDHFDVRLRFGPSEEREATSVFFAWLVFNPDEPTGVVYGVAPAGLTELALPVVGQDPDEAPAINVTEFYQRPAVDRSVFIGTFDTSTITGVDPPIQFEPWIAAPAGVDIDSTFLEAFGLQTADISDTYTGSISGELFWPAQELVTGSVTVDAFPAVLTCRAPNDVELPSNQGRTVADGAVHPTARAAFEAFMDGELSDSWLPQAGYVELTDPSGNVAFVKPYDGAAVDAGVVMLVEVVPVDGGWTVSRWEGSGC